jgi:hypothetical protein
LQHGDDSAAQILRCSTGEQVAELQGKIEPFAFAEECFGMGSYYNNALIGIENNRDGGANKVLFELGYKNIYFEMKEVGLPYQKPTAKLGYNMNARTRAMLVALARKYMEDGSLHIRSQWLLTQMETFALEGEKFQAIANAFDDLIMAMLIACEMMRVQLLRGAVSSNNLKPLWNGEEVEKGIEDLDEALSIDPNKTRVQRLIDSKTKSNYQQSIVEASTMGNLAGF